MVLIIDDVDVPLPRPLLHTVAVIEPGVQNVDTGALQPGTAGIRFIPGSLGHRRYAGPRPIPDHVRMPTTLLPRAADSADPDAITCNKALLKQMAGRVLARGTLTGTY